MAPDQIEVERKYSAGDGVEAIARRVADLGGSEIGSVAFTDTYYDTPECALTSNDVWLRRRDEKWEIKVPIAGDARRSGGERTVFREVEGAAGCLDELEKVLGTGEAEVSSGTNRDERERERERERESANDELRLERFAASKAVAPFASFATTRAKFSLDGASIDVDCASFGHTVVEVEVLCGDANEVPAAEEKVNAVAAKLLLTEIGATGGKLETFLRKNCPKHLEALVANGILKP
jgi:thiamine-triphosphatase